MGQNIRLKKIREENYYRLRKIKIELLKRR